MDLKIPTSTDGLDGYTMEEEDLGDPFTETDSCDSLEDDTTTVTFWNSVVVGLKISCIYLSSVCIIASTKLCTFL